MSARRSGVREAVLRRLVLLGSEGATSNELSAWTGLALHTVTPRVLELRIAGEVVATGAKRRTPSGELAQVWRVAKPGEARPEARTVRPRRSPAVTRAADEVLRAAVEFSVCGVGNYGEAYGRLSAAADAYVAATTAGALRAVLGCRYCREAGLEVESCQFCGPKLNRRLVRQFRKMEAASSRLNSICRR